MQIQKTIPIGVKSQNEILSILIKIVSKVHKYEHWVIKEHKIEFIFKR